MEPRQCTRRPFGPSNLYQQQSHPGPIPVTPYIYSTHSPDTKKPFSITHQPNTPIFHIDSGPRPESCLGPWHCEAAVPTTVSLCHVHMFYSSTLLIPELNHYH